MNDLSRIGILGGSFDPIHNGHLIIAQDALETFKLDRVLLIPAAQSPLKKQRTEASAASRLEMTRLAIEGEDHFEVSSIEIDRGGQSFAIDTIGQLSRAHPKSRLFWILGADQARLLDQWRDIAKIAKSVEFICLDRNGNGSGAFASIENLKMHFLAGHKMDISSSEIRTRLKKGLPVKYFLPHLVLEYIKTKGTYMAEGI